MKPRPADGVTEREMIRPVESVNAEVDAAVALVDRLNEQIREAFALPAYMREADLREPWDEA